MFSQKRRSTYVQELFQVVDPVVAFKKLPEEIAKSLGKVLIHVTYSNGVVKPYTLAKLIVKMEEKESFVLDFPSIFKEPVSVVEGKVPAAVVVEDEPTKDEAPVKEDKPVVEEKVEETPAPKTEVELEKAPVEVVEEKVEEVAEDVVEAEPAEVVEEEPAAAVGISIGGKGGKKKKK